MISNQYQRFSFSAQTPLKEEQSTGKSLDCENSCSNSYSMRTSKRGDKMEISTRCEMNGDVQESPQSRKHVKRQGFRVIVHSRQFLIDIESVQTFEKSFELVNSQNNLNPIAFLALKIVILERIGKIQQDFKSLKQKLLILYSNSKLEMISEL